MAQEESLYDIAIAGGGLAGLALSIQSANAGYKTVLFEKEKYPFHRVCGEYISLESRDFLESLGLSLNEMNLPLIKKLLVSAPNGKYIEHNLPLGGIGISRYKLDALLASIAGSGGVEVRDGTKVNDVIFEDDAFRISVSPSSARSRIMCGSFGKRSNLDIKWNRKFIKEKHSKLNNYIGVKYHVHYDWPDDKIALHNFQDGYCGISRVEDGKCCLCYLTTANNLQASNNNVEEMEKRVLSKNPFLQKIFQQAKKLFDVPVTISQISFEKKSLVENKVLMVGDAAGMITPLCGNGMSMALHASKLAYENIRLFLSGSISRQQMENSYTKAWQNHFSSRMKTGRAIQQFFGKEVATNRFIGLCRTLPFIITPLIKQTHGKPF